VEARLRAQTAQFPLAGATHIDGFLACCGDDDVEDVNMAARMMNQAKFGTIRSEKILDINQREKVGKSAKTCVYQSRMMILDHPVEYPEPITNSFPPGSVSV
jgi:hypothetical protein